MIRSEPARPPVAPFTAAKGDVAVTQALIAIGGRAKRLRDDGVHVGTSKAFMISGRRSMLFWCLRSLHTAGIRRIVLAGDRPEHLDKAHRVLDTLDAIEQFDEVIPFEDEGMGVHGIPYQAIGHLEPHFLFEAGHGVSHPHHYRRMIELKGPENVVFSAFRPDARNPRYRTGLDERGTCVPPTPGGPGYSLAHPMVIDHRYAESLLDNGFDVNRMADDYRTRRTLTAVVSELPPEFDLGCEFEVSLQVYRSNIARERDAECPWGPASRRTAPPRRRVSTIQGTPDGADRNAHAERDVCCPSRTMSS